MNLFFGKGNFFLELQDHGLTEQADVNQRLIRLAAETGIELVATNDVHYTYAEDEKPHDILLCIQTGKKLTDENRMHYAGGQYYVKSEQEMIELSHMQGRRWKIRRRLQIDVMWRLNLGVTKLPKIRCARGNDFMGISESTLF